LTVNVQVTGVQTCALPISIHADDAFAALLDIYGLLHKKYASKADLEDVVRAVREITEHALANSGEK
jgi:hypothetical protein